MKIVDDVVLLLKDGKNVEACRAIAKSNYPFIDVINELVKQNQSPYALIIRRVAKYHSFM